MGPWARGPGPGSLGPLSPQVAPPDPHGPTWAHMDPHGLGPGAHIIPRQGVLGLYILYLYIYIYIYMYISWSLVLQIARLRGGKK